MSITLLKRDIMSCIKPFFLIFFVMSLYTTIIIYMYNPKLSDMLNDYQQLLPEFMSAVGMTGIASSLLEWIKIYLYGFIMMLFPLIFIIILNDKLVMSYIDSGAMANLLATPNCRRKIILTQMIASCVWIILLMLSVTIVGIISSYIWFPGELEISIYIKLNIATLLLQLVITALSFLAASCFDEKKYYYTIGAGIPILFFLIQMISNMGEKLEYLKYVTIYTLLPLDKIIEGNSSYISNLFILVILFVLLFVISVIIFCNRDLSL